MSWLSSFLKPGRGYEKAQEQLDKYYNEAQGYQKPIFEQGQGAYGNLAGAMGSLLDPAALQGKWIESYQTSPAALNAQKMASQQGLNAASSMGLMGSSPALSAIQQGTSQIGMEDRQNYLNDLMQKYLAGAGIAQNIYGIGAGAAGNMGQNAMNQGQNAAQMSYGRANAGGNMLGNLLGTAAGAGMGLATGGMSNIAGMNGQRGGGWNLFGG